MILIKIKLRKKLKGTFLVFTLVLVSVSMILALSIYKLKIILLKNDFVRRNQIVSDINAESILNEAYASFLLGEKSPYSQARKTIKKGNEEYELGLSQNGKRDFVLRVKSTFYQKSLSFSVIPITDFYKIYEKELGITFAETKTRMSSPIYAPKISINLQKAGLEIISDYRSPVPNLVAGKDIRISFSGSNALLSLSKIIGDGSGMPIRYKTEEYKSDFSKSSGMAKTGIELELGKIRFKGNRPLVISENVPKRKVLNPFLNQKDFIFVTTSAKTYTAPSLREMYQDALRTPRLFVAPPSTRENKNHPSVGKMLLNPWLYSDSMGFEPSYTYDNGIISFFPESQIYKVPITEEMVVGANEFQLAVSQKSVISIGRRISKVYLENADTEVPFEYDEGNRFLKIKYTGNLAFVGYADGRKTDFQLPVNSNPKVFFVNGKKVSGIILDNGLGSSVVRIDPAPAYGQMVQSMEKVPLLFIQKEAIPSGSYIFTDPIEEVSVIDLARIGIGSYDSFYSEDSLYLEGDISTEIRVESGKDIYLGNVTMNHKLAAKGRLIFLDFSKEKSLTSKYENLILSVLNEEILPLGSPGTAISISGTFLFGQRLRPFAAGDNGPIGIYSQRELPQNIQLVYDTSFVSSPSKDLLLFVRR